VAACIHLPRVYSSIPMSGGSNPGKGGAYRGSGGWRDGSPQVGSKGKATVEGGDEVPQKLKPFCKLLGIHKF